MKLTDIVRNKKPQLRNELRLAKRKNGPAENKMNNPVGGGHREEEMKYNGTGDWVGTGPD